MRIYELVWTKENEEHIAEHHVTRQEVEELFFEEAPYFPPGRTSTTSAGKVVPDATSS